MCIRDRISSIYGLVDTAMVGQYQGPDGAAALAIFAPIWNIIYSLGLLAGIGGSILFAAARGSRNDGTENRFFTAAVLLCAGLSALCWGADPPAAGTHAAAVRRR